MVTKHEIEEALRCCDSEYTPCKKVHDLLERILEEFFNDTKSDEENTDVISSDITKLDNKDKMLFAKSMELYYAALDSIGSLSEEQLHSFIKDTFEKSHPGIECTF